MNGQVAADTAGMLTLVVSGLTLTLVTQVSEWTGGG